MCDEYVKQPLGEAEVEHVWQQYNSVARAAMESDIYTHGGLLDTVQSPAFPGFYASPTRGPIESSFTYEELQFISRCRLFSMTVPDIERLISLLNKFKDVLSNNSDPINTNGCGYFPQRTYRPFQPYVPQQSTVQPLYGCPAPNNASNDGITPRMDSNSLATISMPNENGIAINTEKVSLTEDSSAEAILKRAEEIDNAVRTESSDEKCGD